MIIFNDIVTEYKKNNEITLYSKNKKLFSSDLSIYDSDSNVIFSGLLKDDVTPIVISIHDKKLSSYRVEITKKFQRYHSYFSVLQLEENEQYIICDIDYTVSATNVFLYLTEKLLSLKKVFNSSDILKKLSEKYRIIYLTGRIMKYNHLTKEWLRLNGFPDGPLISRDYNIPRKLDIFKTKVVKNVADISKNGIGIGDLNSDIIAYLNNNLIAIKIKTRRFSFLNTNDYEFKDNHYIVDSWRGIEKVFKEIIDIPN